MNSDAGMVQVAFGGDGPRVRRRAAEILGSRGINLEKLDPAHVRVDVARTQEGKTRWYVWVSRDILGAPLTVPEEVE